MQYLQYNNRKRPSEARKLRRTSDMGRRSQSTASEEKRLETVDRPTKVGEME